MNPWTRPWSRSWNRARQRVNHSLKWKLVRLFLLLALGTTVIFLVGMKEIVRLGWQGWGRPLLADYVTLLAADIGTPPDVERAKALVARLPISLHIDGPQVQWDSHPQRPAPWQRIASPGNPEGMIHIRTLADGHRLVFGLAPPSPAAHPKWVGWGTLTLLLAITWIAFRHVRHLLRPLDDIRAGAIRFGRGEFDDAIPVRRDDELGDLARQVNTMAQEIRAMLDAKRGLLLAISHELRSPLTRARVNAELIDDSPERAALLRDLAEMRDLVSDLLESERLASGHAALQREPTDLNALVADTLAAHFAGQPVEQQLAPALPMLALDRMRLRLLLRNAVDNALRHAADAGRPPVVATRLDDDGGVTLSVRDHGPGVPPEQLAQLSQAFYRLDRARQRSTGGVGLGLYLCRLVAQAHGSALQIRLAGPGLEVSMRFAPPGHGGTDGARTEP